MMMMIRDAMHPRQEEDDDERPPLKDTLSKTHLLGNTFGLSRGYLGLIVL